MPPPKAISNPEQKRLVEASTHEYDWKLWGPYLSERQWATVREDYSPDGNCWDYFPYEAALRRAYRWGEDGLLGISDRKSRLCFSLALWNEKDPFLKERLFGLTGPEGNHGEDVKEEYFYLDSTPTHSYMKALYKYPQAAFPYQELREENARRGIDDPEFELIDTGVFEENRYFDVQAEYAKDGPEDILIKITVTNRGPEAAPIHIMPTWLARNTWSWGAHHEGDNHESLFFAHGKYSITTEHQGLGTYTLNVDARNNALQGMLFVDNDTHHDDVEDGDGKKYYKDGMNRYIVDGVKECVNPKEIGSKSAFYFKALLEPGEEQVIRLRMYQGIPKKDEFLDFDDIFAKRLAEAEHFYDGVIGDDHSPEEKRVMRQAYAGLLWSKQFYYYVVKEWMRGDALQPAPPSARTRGRNSNWMHLYNRDIISMPDKWEYPWYASWDLAFHMVPFSAIDPHFAKQQLVLLLREWYMHPNGQIPAYEFEFGAVNPPVHAWAALSVYRSSGKPGWRDREFLVRIFHKLLINFTWWINRTDVDGKNLFSGGFLGLDNIGIFDRGATLPTGGVLEQADATAWIGFYCANMLEIAVELARVDRSYGDIASKFFEHFMTIKSALNGDRGLWSAEDGFYYDSVRIGDKKIPLKVRSMVGIIPIFAATIIEEHVLAMLPGFKHRFEWFMLNQPELAVHVISSRDHRNNYLVSLASPEQLRSILSYVFDEDEFLSPFGIRSLSKYHKDHPLVFKVGAEEYRVDYAPGNSETTMFGGNSNWRGPIWFPLNQLFIESLLTYHQFFGDDFTMEYPTGSGIQMNLKEIAADVCCRLSRLFLYDPETSERPFWGREGTRAGENWNELILFHEFFHGDNGAGLGASHQTGWTALVTWCLDKARELGATP